MLYALQENSAETSKYLVNVIKNLKITDYYDNNVEIIITLIYGVVSCLRNLVYANSKSASPDDFADYLLDVFKTTSVSKLNALFLHYSIAIRLTKFQTKKSNKPRISDILSFTDTQYLGFHYIEQWSVVDNKINATSFTAIYNGNCFNCGVIN